jgi:hypothetical protein
VWRLGYVHEIPISRTLGNRGEDLGSSDRRNRIGETVPAIFGYLDARVPRLLSRLNVQKPSTSRQSNLMHPANFTANAFPEVEYAAFKGRKSEGSSERKYRQPR